MSGGGLPAIPSTYYAAASRPPSARAVRDAQLRGEISRVWKENREVYGADKVWLALNRQGTRVARCTTERLMRDLALHGVRRGRTVRTTVPGKNGQRAADLLKRDFTAPAPNRRWVAFLALQVAEQVPEIALQCVGAALAVLAEVVTEEPVEQRGVDHGEVAVDLRGGHPGVQGAAGEDVGVHGRRLEWAAVAVGDGPQVVGELGQGGSARGGAGMQ